MPARRIMPGASLFLVFTLSAACGGGSGKSSAAKSATNTSTTVTGGPTTSTTAPKPDQTPKVANLNDTLMLGGAQVIFHGVTVPYPEPDLEEGSIVAAIDAEVKNPGAAPVDPKLELVLLDATNGGYRETNSHIQPAPPDGVIPPNSSKRGTYSFQILDAAKAPGLRLLVHSNASSDTEEEFYEVTLVPGGSPPQAPSASPVDPAKVYAKDEPAAVGWGVLVMHGVKNPAPPLPYGEPKAGMRFVTIDFEMFNTSKQTHSGYDFEDGAQIQDAQNQTFKHGIGDRTTHFPDEVFTNYMPATLGRRGPLTFQIPEASGAGALKLLFTYHDADTKKDTVMQFALS
ncbi:MAG: hypothetical protein QOI86_3363 [Actinomycetota bacterium]|nr:hypothetical protein [Actinomycetota bacterium]